MQLMIMTEKKFKIPHLITSRGERKNGAKKRANRYVLQKFSYNNREEKMEKLRQANIKAACDITLA